jgi:hypothetical protein
MGSRMSTPLPPPEPAPPPEEGITRKKRIHPLQEEANSSKDVLVWLDDYWKFV